LDRRACEKEQPSWQQMDLGGVESLTLPCGNANRRGVFTYPIALSKLYHSTQLFTNPCQRLSPTAIPYSENIIQHSIEHYVHMSPLREAAHNARFFFLDCSCCDFTLQWLIGSHFLWSLFFYTALRRLCVKGKKSLLV